MRINRRKLAGIERTVRKQDQPQRFLEPRGRVGQLGARRARGRHGPRGLRGRQREDARGGYAVGENVELCPSSFQPLESVLDGVRGRTGHGGDLLATFVSSGTRAEE